MSEGALMVVLVLILAVVLGVTLWYCEFRPGPGGRKR
jgi:hypothetical protein